MTNPKFSIIISVYNVEKYLRETLESVVNQTLKDIEIICINDGSTDNSLNILDEYARKDSRIKVINQENQGLASSRNNALNIATGEYFLCVDSDDYIRKDSLELVYKKAKNMDLDMLSFGGTNFDDKTRKDLGNPYYEFKYLPAGFNTNCFTYKNCIHFITKMAVSSCLTAYRLDFIKKNYIEFPAGLCFEDNVFFCKALLNAKRCGILNEKLYFRRIHNASITQNWEKHFGDYLKITDLVLSYLKNINIDYSIWSQYEKYYIEGCINLFNNYPTKTRSLHYESLRSLAEKYNKIYLPCILKPLKPLEKIFSIKNNVLGCRKNLAVCGVEIKIKASKLREKKRLLELEKNTAKLSSRLLACENQLNKIETCYKNMIEKTTPHPELKNISVDIVSHCNLNCQCCDHFSPLAEKSFANIDIFEKDINRLSEISNATLDVLKLMGGEPLLHPKLKYVNRELEKTGLNVNNYIIGNNNDKNLQLVIKKYPQILNKIEERHYLYRNKLEKIFSIKNNPITCHKVITICGLKIKIKSNKLKQKKQIKNLEKNIESEIKALNNQIKQQIKKANYTINSNYEISACRRFYSEIENGNLIKDYKNLIKSLDNDSIEQISKILSRIQLIAISQESNFDIFSKEEIEQINKVKNSMIQGTIQLSDDCWAYNKYLLPINHFEPSVFYYRHNIDCLKNLKTIKDRDIIDVGGFIGDSAIVFEDFTDKKIYTFEPVNENYNNILKTIKLNNSSKIVPVKTGLGSKEEDVEIYLQDSGSSINRILNKDASIEIIHNSTLDKFVEENNLNVGLIKVDIEGYEQEFLKGAIKTIKTQKPSLLISIYHNASDFFKIKPLIESWDLGYSFQIVKPIDGSVRGEILLIAEYFEGN